MKASKKITNTISKIIITVNVVMIIIGIILLQGRHLSSMLPIKEWAWGILAIVALVTFLEIMVVSGLIKHFGAVFARESKKEAINEKKALA